MKDLITEEGFTKLTGRAPENDDLDRINCEEVGKPGHYACGVCPTCGKPAWDCEHFPETINTRRHG